MPLANDYTYEQFRYHYILNVNIMIHKIYQGSCIHFSLFQWYSNQIIIYFQRKDGFIPVSTVDGK